MTAPNKNTLDIPLPNLLLFSVVAFMFFEVGFALGAPFHINEVRSTGGWIGPLNIILAQNFTEGNSSDVNGADIVVDRYETRYVQTPMSPLIMMSPNMTLPLAREDFSTYFGVKAINNTAQLQASGKADPYEPFLNTCDNGNASPLLPLYEFEFVRDPKTGNETINVKLEYKLLTIPDENARAWK